MLCYFLGEITPEYRQAIHGMAGGLPVINIHDKSDNVHYNIHPDEFVYLVEHADVDAESVGEKLGALLEKSLKYLRECLKV